MAGVCVCIVAEEKLPQPVRSFSREDRDSSHERARLDARGSCRGERKKKEGKKTEK